jgi:spore maturation protein CgeB
MEDSIPDGYDLYLCIDDGFDNNQPARKYKSGSTIFYAIDTHMTFRSKVQKAAKYDFIFCAQKDGSEKMRSLGLNASWVPLGFDENIHRKHDTEKIYDLAFVGNIDHFYDRLKLKKRYEKKYRIFIGEAPYSELSRIYSQSKIVLNLPVNNDLNMRFFEALGSGSFLLSKKIHNGEDDITGDKVHRVSFFGWWDLDRKIAYYLDVDEEREAIAEAGHKLAVDNFTYTHRIKQILNIVSDKSMLIKGRPQL